MRFRYSPCGETKRGVGGWSQGMGPTAEACIDFSLFGEESNEAHQALRIHRTRTCIDGRHVLYRQAHGRDV